MARTPLLNWLRQVSRDYGQNRAASPSYELEMTRRDFLKVAFGATMGAIALTGNHSAVQALLPVLPSQPSAKSAQKPVIIVGGGLAGLTTAYRLSQNNVSCALYEASPRLGGRVFTKNRFNTENMFVELGGELVDTVHTDLISLCGELNVPLETFDATGEVEPALYYSHGQVRTGEDVLAAFAPLAKAIESDLQKIFPGGEVSIPTYQTPFNSQWLDEMTLETYLNVKMLENRIEPWLIDLIKVAYTIEYGLECREQSALNLLILIGCDIQNGFRIFGDSDEAMRIQGGNSRLVNQLASAVQGTVPMHANHRLTGITANDTGIQLTFVGNGKTVQVEAERVVLAMPLTVLRQIKGIDQLALSPVKKRFIQELGYGTNAKQMVGFKHRFWKASESSGQSSLPTCGGDIFSDWPSQTYWETSRKQVGNAGILTNFLGGAIGKDAQNNQWQKALKDLESVYPKVQKQFDGNTAFFNWSRNPWALGSYACPKPGQYTSLIGAGMEPELDGRLYLAGEHCSVDWMGFMNGAIDSGNRVAKALCNTTASIGSFKQQAHIST
jgi:monoamine oxidase